MRTIDATRVSRREILSAGATAAVLAGCAIHPGHGDDGGVTPAEDLMREHGVLRRVLFVFDDAAQRLEIGATPPMDALAAGASIIRRVIEDYHERLEEQHLFPRFEKAGKLTALVATLREQHAVGRRITTRVLALTSGTSGDHAELARALRAFSHMYRPHAAREDTVLFPALHELVGGAAYRELGEQFEDIEQQTLGAGGFEHAVVDVARIEQAFGLDDLATLTPRDW